MVVLELTMPDGQVLERGWTAAEVRGGEAPRWITWDLDRFPAWILDKDRRWDPPHPIVVTGRVKPGCKAKARATILEGVDAWPGD